MNGLTNATSWDVARCPKHQTAKWCCWFNGHSLTRVGLQKTWIFISLHRLQIRHSKILLILARSLPIGYFTFYYSDFFIILIFSDFNRMDAWSLMRGDAFIHFVSGSRRVNIRLGVLLLIPKSPQFIPWIRIYYQCTVLTANMLLPGTSSWNPKPLSWDQNVVSMHCTYCQCAASWYFLLESQASVLGSKWCICNFSKCIWCYCLIPFSFLLSFLFFVVFFLFYYTFFFSFLMCNAFFFSISFLSIQTKWSILFIWGGNWA